MREQKMNLNQIIATSIAVATIGSCGLIQESQAQQSPSKKSLETEKVFEVNQTYEEDVLIKFENSRNYDKWDIERSIGFRYVLAYGSEGCKVFLCRKKMMVPNADLGLVITPLPKGYIRTI